MRLKPKTMIDFLKSKFQSPSVWERMIFFVLYAAVIGLAVWAANKFTQPMVSETTNTILTGAVGIFGVGFGVYLASKK